MLELLRKVDELLERKGAAAETTERRETSLIQSAVLIAFGARIFKCTVPSGTKK